MNVYGTEQIRNVVLLGHGGSGKTTVAEAMAFLTGVTKRMGKVPDGNTISDYDKEEIKRQFSISTTLIPLEYQGESGPIKINLLDTPGFFDFVGEVEEAISVADAAIIVVNCKAGIEPGTEKAWEICEKYNLPRLIFVTNMDDDHASYRELVVKLETRFGRKIAPFQLPIRENEKFVGFVNVVKMAGRRFTTLSDYEECPIPDYVQKNLTIARDALIEAVAETSEEYMERYFLGEEFTQEEISTALRTHVIQGDIVPVMMGSGLNCQGFKVLLQAIDKYFPSPDHFECIGVDVSTGERFTAKYNDDVNLSARVFKTIVDPFIGKYSLMKICTGTLKGDTVVYNVNKDMEEKIGKLYVLRGKEQIEVPELKAGDIGAVAKLTVTQTGDTMAVRTAPIVYHKPQISTPYTYMAYKAVNKGEDDKVSTALARMMEEDLTLKVVNDAENRQSLLYGIGDQQLDVVLSKLQNRYKVDVTLSKPKFAFRETIRKKVKVQGRHKKQSGGHGQFGDVIMEFEPSGDLEKPYVFEEKVFGGSVPKNYFPAVEKGLQDCVVKGPLAGYPVVGLKATLLDGSYHPVDSSEMAFKMATILAFKSGFMDANPVLLEPIASLKVTVPDKFTGDVMGDLNRRRGRVLGMNSDHHGKQVIEADIPMSELFGYNTDLRSMTGGIGLYSYEFSRYEQAPGDVQKREVEARAAAKEAE
ncbi:elongation factor G [Clostridium sp. AF18-27]|uniref:Translation elongation factor 2 (EF-2/EF-G) n=1 Tax=Enterocloster lavalensis TaxID=460384 RepID=A0A1I0AJ38_9FIRM|nr:MULTISPECIES: elongation factor G [Enterocloster]RHR53798.1 elongation factor G [Clostridium sp. AF18-27]MCB6344580.1 elongation factor G [Enterocloster lavalensis]MDR3759910.1 elongation factor G [Enterocloster sp.]PST33358.1 elongation factor G [Enterocloster lavalensis]SES94317.1 translation elongation factor 2 (EF-2/EF-G) [Enterocloster lavalensis]